MSRPYVVYGNRRSGSATAEAALAAIGAEYEVREIDLGSGRQRHSAYRAVNPQRKLPTLITPQGETLTESVAILLTLAERHPDAGLLPPPGVPERAQALRWLLFVATELYPIVEINDYPERFVPVGGDAAATRARARELWRRRWLVVEENVGGDPYLLPSGFTITDVYVAVVSRWAQQDDWRPTNLPKVERLASAVAAHPAIGPVWQRHFGG